MKKNTKNVNLKRGISLIVLVITIIVIVILAVAVILSIANNNPIENAKTAKELHNQATLEEAANLAYTTMYTNAKINGEEIDYAEMTKDIQKNLNEQGFSKDEVKKVKATKDGIEIKEIYNLKSINFYREEGGPSFPFFGMYYRDSISKVIFEDSTANAPENANDLSEEGNGSILGWVDGSEVYIASDGIICAPKDCSYMFKCLYSCGEIVFNNFDTSNVTDMSFMFDIVENLPEIDLSGFDTSNVKFFTGMFRDCRFLKTIYVSEKFVVSNVWEDDVTFQSCESLVGEKGTVYNENHIGSVYARIDGGPDSATPGYFTLKQ